MYSPRNAVLGQVPEYRRLDTQGRSSKRARCKPNLRDSGPRLVTGRMGHVTLVRPRGTTPSVGIAMAAQIWAYCLKYIESISQDLHFKGSERPRATVEFCWSELRRLRLASGIVGEKIPPSPAFQMPVPAGRKVDPPCHSLGQSPVQCLRGRVTIVCCPQPRGAGCAFSRV
jgi:hypothetical protein